MVPRPPAVGRGAASKERPGMETHTTAYLKEALLEEGTVWGRGTPVRILKQTGIQPDGSPIDVTVALPNGNVHKLHWDNLQTSIHLPRIKKGSP